MAIPKIFQTFNSLLGSIVRKSNATVVGPSKQLVGEFPPITFERLYQYYHGWDMIKTSMDVMHQKFMGAGIKVSSNNEAYNTFIKKWWDVTNAQKKLSDFFMSVFITGNGILELQYTADGRLGNLEQIPMQTIYRIFRDQYANELKLVQIVDGVFKELDPQYFVHWMINNPDKEAFGKSQFHSLAAPRPITPRIDPATGEPLGRETTLRPLLDSQAILQNAEVEIKERLSKPIIIAYSANANREQLAKIELEMSDPDRQKYVWFFDKPVDIKEAGVMNNTKFDKYGENVDAHIDIATTFASKTVTNPTGYSYAGSQTPFDVLDQRMVDMQSDAREMIKDKILRPCAESWGFTDFDEMEVEISFQPTVRRLSMEDIQKLPTDSVSPKEKRKILKDLHIDLDDDLFEEYNNEQKEEKAKQLDAMKQGKGEPFEKGISPLGQVSPTASKPEGNKPAFGGKNDRFGKPQQPFGESYADNRTIIKDIAEEVVKLLKAQERIPLPPSAVDKSSDDLYVSQGIDSASKLPTITDPSVKKTYGEDDEDLRKEHPPGSPTKTLRAIDKQKPNIDIEDTNQLPEDQTQGGTGDDRITSQSDGTLKDPLKGASEQPDLEEPSITPEISQTNVGPTQKTEDVLTNVAGGSEKPLNNQILGSPEEDEQPLVPSEGDPRDLDKQTVQNQQQVKPRVQMRAPPQIDTKGLDPLEVPDRDAVKDNDPMTSGVADSVIKPERPEENVGSKLPQLQDKPPFETPKTPEDIPQESNMESPHKFSNQGDGMKVVDDAIDKPNFPPQETKPDSVPVQNSKNPEIDNTGLNMTPEDQRTSIREEPQLGKSFPDGDGNIVAPTDVRQIQPQVTGKDPETGRNITNQLDEQGNPIPDLRFDQTPDSTEEQPEIETKEEEIEAPDASIPEGQKGSVEKPDQMRSENPDQTPKTRPVDDGVDGHKPEEMIKREHQLMGEKPEPKEKKVHQQLKKEFGGKENVSGPPAGDTMRVTTSKPEKLLRKDKSTESKKVKKNGKGGKRKK